jgi:hypothetical protein
MTKATVKLQPEQPLSKYVSVSVAARILGISTSRIRQVLPCGVFKSAFKPGFGRNANWKILRSEISEYKLNSQKQNSYGR